MSTAISSNDRSHPMAPLCQRWIKKIEEAKKVKWERFGKYAAETTKFYDGPQDWMWKEEYSSGAGGFLEKGTTGAMPMFRMQMNRVFEAVALFGPALYHKNPDITVTPVSSFQVDPQMLGIDPNNPQMKQQYEQIIQGQKIKEAMREVHGNLYQHYANWVQRHTDKKTHSRMAITEALVKGMGLLWTELYQPAGASVMYPRSVYVSVDDIIIDPDAEYWEDVQYIARYYCEPVNKVEERFGLPYGSLKAQLKSKESQGYESGYKRDESKLRKYGKTYDLNERWEIFSKNGFGDRLRKGDGGSGDKIQYDAFGDFTYIVVSKGVPYALNIPPAAIMSETPQQIFDRSQWPIPFWTDGGWPFSRLGFYGKPRSVWPVSLFKPVIGELRFVNWCMSFLADRVAAGSGSYIAVSKQAGMEIQNQLKNGMAPYTVIEISQLTGRSINDVVSFLDSPTVNTDIWSIVAEVNTRIDKGTGLSELLYGMSEKQMRSATEADIRGQNVNIRPDDMAAHVEDFLSEAAMKEIEAMVWGLDKSDVEPAIGDLGASIFEQQIQTQDFERLVMDYDYKVAAGSARKPNKNTKQRALTEIGQVILQTIQTFAMEGQVSPWNAYVTEVCKTLDIDSRPFMIEAPQQAEGPDPEQQKAEMELKVKQFEAEMKKQAGDVELQQKREEGSMDMKLKQQQLEQQKDEHRQDMRAGEEEMEMKEEENAQQILFEKAKQVLMTREATLKMKLEKQKANAQVAASDSNGDSE